MSTRRFMAALKNDRRHKLWIDRIVWIDANSRSSLAQQAGGSNGASGKESFQISAPSISLPKGGGAIRGMGEKFAANPVTGTGSMTVPIATSPGRSGFGP